MGYKLEVMPTIKAIRKRSKMPTKNNPNKKPRKSQPRLKTRIGIQAAGALLLNNPDGLYRSQIVKKLGLNKRAWQSIQKADIFSKHPDSSPKAKKVKWVVDAPVYRRRYMTHQQRADAIIAKSEPRQPLDGMEPDKPKAASDEDKFIEFHKANAPEGVGLVDFFTGSPPYKTADAGQVVSLTIGQTHLEMTINGSVSFTIRG